MAIIIRTGRSLAESRKSDDCHIERLLIDTYHMSIEKRGILTSFAAERDILAHVHLVETNRDVIGAGRWPTAAFLDALKDGYEGYCSVGVFDSR